MDRTIPLAQHIFTRLRQLNCHSIHGVPGDFFLRALDHTRSAGIKWIGNANELCAGYAADGYARAGFGLAAGRSGKGPKVGALFTTYGVGELSAINAVAGSWAESVPVFHMVGAPSRTLQRTATELRPIHHSLPGSALGIYAEMASHITCDRAELQQASDPTAAAYMADRVLEQCVKRSKPGYVSIPSDMMESPVPVELLRNPLDFSFAHGGEEWEEEGSVESIVKWISDDIHEARKPLIIVDGLAYPAGFADEVNELADVAQIPVVSYTSGKGIGDESSPYWCGVMRGPSEVLETADLVLHIGPIHSDTNTAAWTALPQTQNVFHINYDTVGPKSRLSHEKLNFNQSFRVEGKAVLQVLISRLREDPPKDIDKVATTTPKPSRQAEEAAKPAKDQLISQDAFWKRMSDYLRPDDTVLYANGTPLVGSRNMLLPPGRSTQIIASSIWCSIGHMLPAAQGVSLAKRDNGLPGRTILFEGDGSFQVTCQSLSDIIRYNLDVTIFIINNSGYTYERWLNGMDEDYNDVPAWRYTEAAKFFGAKDTTEYPIFTSKVQTWQQLEELLPKLQDGKGLTLIDVVMDPRDVPGLSKAGLLRASEALKKQADMEDGKFSVPPPPTSKDSSS